MQTSNERYIACHLITDCLLGTIKSIRRTCSDLYLRHVSEDRKIIAQLDLIHSYKPLTKPNAYSLARWQTPIRNQGGRGTCYTFACVAAMEAMYNRTFGLMLDLSEHYAFQLGKIGELYPDYMTNTRPHESNTSYWGGQGNSTFLNVISKCAIPLELEAPYLSQVDFEKIRTSLGLPLMNDFETITQETIDEFEFDERTVPVSARSLALYQGTGYAMIGIEITDIESAIVIRS